MTTGKPKIVSGIAVEIPAMAWPGGAQMGWPSESFNFWITASVESRIITIDWYRDLFQGCLLPAPSLCGVRHRSSGS